MGAKAQSERAGGRRRDHGHREARVAVAAGRPVSLDDTMQALSLVNFELKQAKLKLPSEREVAARKRPAK